MRTNVEQIRKTKSDWYFPHSYYPIVTSDGMTCFSRVQRQNGSIKRRGKGSGADRRHQCRNRPVPGVHEWRAIVAAVAQPITAARQQ